MKHVDEALFSREAGYIIDITLILDAIVVGI